MWVQKFEASKNTNGEADIKHSCVCVDGWIYVHCKSLPFGDCGLKSQYATVTSISLHCILSPSGSQLVLPGSQQYIDNYIKDRVN